MGMPTAAGLYYYFHDGGSTIRPALIFIHGIGGDHLSWPPELRRMPGFRVYTLDLPGHGKTAGPGLQHVQDYARKVLDFMDVVDLSRAVLVGHGLGGAVAIEFAIEKPERVAGAALISSGPRLPILSTILEDAANASTFPLAVNALYRLMLGSQTPDRLAQSLRANLESARQALLYGDLLACDHFDAADRLETIQTPALVVCGTDDRLTPVRFSELLASRIRGAALQTIDGAGHLVVLEQPRRLAALLNVFLATLSYLPGM
jgi:pimeloyl-ACP methyl ester carboxylesterase